MFNFSKLNINPVIDEPAAPVNLILVERENEAIINKMLLESQKLLDINYKDTLVKEGLDDNFKRDVGLIPQNQGKFSFAVNNSQRPKEQGYAQGQERRKIDFLSSEGAMCKFFLRF